MVLHRVRRRGADRSRGRVGGLACGCRRLSADLGQAPARHRPTAPVPAPRPPATAPNSDAFRLLVTRLQKAQVRPEVVLREAPAPTRLAPHAFSLTAELAAADEPLADGRLVLLFDPARPEAWDGCLRFVTFLRAEVDSEMAQDPSLPAVGWSWLLEALAVRGAGHTGAGGAVTRTSSARFGALTGPPELAEIEIRASWSPLDDAVEAHLQAWCDLLCLAAGLPPPGVAALRPGLG